MLQLRPLRQIADGCVLAHEAEKHLAGCKCLPDPVDDAAGVFPLLRQDKVPYEHAALQHAVLVEPERTGLAVHLQNGGARDLRIVRRSGVARGRLRQGVFQVRQVYLHEPVEHTQRLDAFVAGAVPHDRDAELQPGERLGDLPRIVTGRDEVDVVHALIAQTQKNAAKLRDGDLFSVLSAADGAVLAEYAPQIAAREKYRAAAACAGNAWFFAEVRRGPRHNRRVRHGAKAELPARTINAAAARTDGAKLCHNASRAWGLARNLWILWIL